MQNLPYPIGSMYGIYANIGGILMANVTIYGIHGSYGYSVSFFMFKHQISGYHIHHLIAGYTSYEKANLA